MDQQYDPKTLEQNAQAHWLAGGMLAFSFCVLLALYSSRRFKSGLN